MSYILDALNKADSERERKRSAVPGLQTQADYGADRDRGGPPWRAIAIGVTVVLLAALAWLGLGRDDKVPAAAAPATPAPLAVAPAPATAPAPVAAPVTAPAAAVPATMPAVVPATLAKPGAPLSPAPTPAIVKPAVVAPAAAPAVAAASAPPRVPARRELPAELRAALPPINISGAVYAPAASGRMLFVNGGVLREGDAIAEGLTIERIGASSSVLVFRGTRFEVSH